MKLERLTRLRSPEHGDGFGLAGVATAQTDRASRTSELALDDLRCEQREGSHVAAGVSPKPVGQQVTRSRIQSRLAMARRHACAAGSKPPEPRDRHAHQLAAADVLSLAAVGLARQEMLTPVHM